MSLLSLDMLIYLKILIVLKSLNGKNVFPQKVLFFDCPARFFIIFYLTSVYYIHKRVTFLNYLRRLNRPAGGQEANWAAR